MYLGGKRDLKPRGFSFSFSNFEGFREWGQQLGSRIFESNPRNFSRFENEGNFWVWELTRVTLKKFSNFEGFWEFSKNSRKSKACFIMIWSMLQHGLIWEKIKEVMNYPFLFPTWTHFKEKFAVFWSFKRVYSAIRRQS